MRQLRARLEPRFQRFARLSADRDSARLGAFAGNGDLTLRGIVRDVQRDQLAQAQARGVEELEHCRVPNERGRTVVLLLEQLLRRLYRQRLGQRTGRLRRTETEHGIGAKAAMAREPAITAAPGGKREREGPRRKT